MWNNVIWNKLKYNKHKTSNTLTKYGKVKPLALAPAATQHITMQKHNIQIDEMLELPKSIQLPASHITSVSRSLKDAFTTAVSF